MAHIVDDEERGHAYSKKGIYQYISRLGHFFDELISLDSSNDESDDEIYP